MARLYSIKETFLTIQGEGARTGARSVFVRFAGCNLWDGNPDHRSSGRGACARWCDTDFAKGEPLAADQLIERMVGLWGFDDKAPGWLKTDPWCVITGGEPLLQLDKELSDRLVEGGWNIAVETNGTVDPGWSVTKNIACLTVSPKRGGKLVIPHANELKVVLPGSYEEPWKPEELLEMAKQLGPDHLFVQPQDPIDPSVVQSSYLHPRPNEEVNGRAQYEKNVALCVDFVHTFPAWRLSLQSHKLVGLP